MTRLEGFGIILLIMAAGWSCRSAPLRREVAGGDPGRGKQVIEVYGCGACHVIPGVRLGRGTVGPPLTSFGERRFIAGAVANTAENLIRWIQTPQAIEPGTAMPALGLSEQEARDASAYLYTLGSPPGGGAPYLFRPEILEKGSR